MHSVGPGHVTIDGKRLSEVKAAKARGMLNNIGDDMVAHCRRMVVKRTGALSRSYMKRVYVSQRGHTLTVFSNLKRGKYYELGTRPHIIRPRTGTVLRFPTRNRPGKRYMYDTIVRHPGSEGHHILPRAAAYALRRYRK